MERDYTSLKNHIELAKKWYLYKYGILDWRWFDEGLIWAVQDFISCTGEFKKDDLKVLEENELNAKFFEEDIKEEL